MTFNTQVVSAWNGAGLGIGSGGPKKQLATRAHDPADPPQLPSLVQDGVELLLTHCLPGPAACVQLFGPVPGLATRVFPPVTPRIWVAPFGIAPPATTDAAPP